MSDKAYIIFCDESDDIGKHYSNFYGGVMVGLSQHERISAALNAEKKRLNLFGEVKWSKVTARYLDKYEALIHAFFKEVHAGHLRVRIMFRQNTHTPGALTHEQLQGTYFRLYYQFIKHAFGLQHRPRPRQPAALRLFFDELPKTNEAVTQFKGFILGLRNNRKIHAAGFSIAPEDIVEIHSHDHVLIQCLDIVLGAMNFRLNRKHEEKLPDGKTRGKRTEAKEKLHETILAEIRRWKPDFDIGATTGKGKKPAFRWKAPYAHWSFMPKAQLASYRKNRNGSTQPTLDDPRRITSGFGWKQSQPHNR